MNLALHSDAATTFLYKADFVKYVKACCTSAALGVQALTCIGDAAVI